MKRGIVLILCLILVLPTVAATISVSGPTETKYNIGDTLDISGYVFQEEEVTGFLQINLNCGNSSYPRQLVTLDLDAGEQKTFTQLNIPEITVTSSMINTCTVEVDLLVAGVSVESDSSDSFIVTKDLTGLFDLDKTKIQMGDSFQLSGTVTKLNAEKVTGTAEIYFENDETEYLIDLISVYGGTINYNYDSANSYPGSYELNIVVRDSYGNEQRFDSIANFEIIDELSVFVDTEESSVIPGSFLEIYGTVSDIDNEPVDQATVGIAFDNEDLSSASLVNGVFIYTLEISPTIKSGPHTLEVDVEDIDGNKGTATATVEITPVATTLENELENVTFDPQDSLNFQVIMYDQAGDIAEGDLTLEIYDSTGTMVSQKGVQSSQELTYKIPQYATPGTWTIKSYVDEVIAEDSIAINEFEDIEMWLDGEMLYVRNNGNVRYKDDLQVLVSGSGYDYTITKKKSVGVNETIIIDLANEVPSGSYSVELPTGNALLSLDNVEIFNGTKRYRFGWLYVLLAVIFIGGLSYLLFGKVPGKKKKGVESKKKFGKRTETVTMPVVKKKEKKPSNTFSKEKSITDFKERVVKDIKATEKMIKEKDAKKARDAERGKLASVLGKAPQSYAQKPRVEKPKEDSSNFFKMFD